MVSGLKAGEIILVDSDKLSKLFESELFKEALCSHMPHFLPSKRWYGSKDDVINSVMIENVFSLNDEEDTFFLIVRVSLQEAEKQFYSIPVRLAWENGAKKIFEAQPQSVIATVCYGTKLGIVYDAVGSKDFATAILSLMRKDSETDVGDGAFLAASATKAGKELIKSVEGASQKLLGVEQSNSSIVVGKKIILKMYRRVAVGNHPEIATTSFLTEEAGFKNTPAYLGDIELKLKAGRPMALGILQAFVPNQGDGWNYTMDYLKKFFADALDKKAGGDYHADYLKMVETLGKRTAEMHKAFAKGKDAVFAPVPVEAGDLESWTEQVLAQAEKTYGVMKNGLGNLSGEIKENTENLLAHWSVLTDRIKALVPENVKAMKTRFHGDYHLGQVVVADKDFYILDFEGEPLRPLMERQIKHTVLKDVAGMVRSFDYAAFGAVLMFVVPEHRAIITPLVSDWQERATSAFLKGYFDNMQGCPSLPDNKQTTQDILDLFVLEKALYEVIYEVANRPDWVAIPLNGMLRLIDLNGERK